VALGGCGRDGRLGRADTPAGQGAALAIRCWIAHADTGRGASTADTHAQTGGFWKERRKWGRGAQSGTSDTPYAQPTAYDPVRDSVCDSIRDPAGGTTIASRGGASA
jgi:hypothetical protein